MKIERGFIMDGERYKYDFEDYTTDKGWAQLDTRQDAWYFGNWVNPFTRQIQTYAEGDTTLTTCDSDEEFLAEMERVFAFYEKFDHEKPGIDPGFNEPLKQKFIELGLGVWLH